MPISGLPGKPTTQGNNQRSRQTLIRFLDANQPASLEQLQGRINTFRMLYNKKSSPPGPGPGHPGNRVGTARTRPRPLPPDGFDNRANQDRGHRGAGQRPVDRVSHPDQEPGLPSRIPREAVNTYASRQFYRRVTESEFSLAEPHNRAELLPMS